MKSKVITSIITSRGVQIVSSIERDSLNTPIGII